MEKRKFRLADVVLSVICVVFVAEAAAPVASIGNSQYFWWLFMIAAFLLPYGLISSELGTAFPGDGGLYDWIHTAWPDSRWGARASWYYWINFPLWMASLAVMCPELLGYVFGWQPGPVWSLLIQLAFIWIVTVVAFYPVCDSIIILNLSAAIKILLAVTVGMQSEMLLRRERALSATDGLLVDACASSLVEQAANVLNAHIVEEATARNLAATSRFSPGYGDLSLSCQPAFLVASGADRALGIHATAAHLLVPTKSITAVIGLRSHPNPAREGGASTAPTEGIRCSTCPVADTCALRAEGRTCYGNPA